MISEQDIEPLLKASNTQGEERTKSRQALIHMLMDRHGTGRLLFRNTRSGVKGFPNRLLHAIKMPLPTQYQTAIKVAEDYGSEKEPRSTSKKRCSILNVSTKSLKVKMPHGGTLIHALNGY